MLTQILSFIMLSVAPFANGAGDTEGNIYLYGEQHAVEKIMKHEVELWSEYYHNENMRHLFIEMPYFAAEFLNIWMQSDNDDILDALYDDLQGTAAYTPATKEFFKAIKKQCPETIFHGTDVGHQYQSTGKRFLQYLEARELSESEQYKLTKEVIEQGVHYYQTRDDAFRENKMAENFIREFDKLDGESIMGIYGGAHTSFDTMDYKTGTVPSMAEQLKRRYGNTVHTKYIGSVTLFL